MITDENRVNNPERVGAADRFFNRKAVKEGWARPELNQGQKPEREKSRADSYFERKSRREGWASNNH